MKTSVMAFLMMSLCAAAADTNYSKAQGYMKLAIAPGTGTTRTLTTLSLPLVVEARLSGTNTGRICAISTNTITDNAANWIAGEISNASVPYFLKITSGVAAGRMFMISTTASNNSTTLTLDASENTDLTTLGIVTGPEGDGYQIYAADTLALLFPPDCGLLAGPDPNSADRVQLFLGGAWRQFYFSSTSNRWSQVMLGSPNASNVPVGPASGILIYRLSATPLSYVLLGLPPTGSRQVTVNNSGVTFLASGWPVPTTLGSSGFQNLPGWRKSSSPSSADTVQLLVGGVWKKFYHDGSNWRQVIYGSPIADTQVVPAGTAYMLDRNAGSGTVVLVEAAPYPN